VSVRDLAVASSEVLTVSKEHERESSFAITEPEATSMVFQLWLRTHVSFSMSGYRVSAYHLVGFLVLDESQRLKFTHCPVVEDSAITGDGGVIAKLS
jgi:hypothetical protein